MGPASPPQTWLVIFDPTLKSLDGHSRNYDVAIAEAARDWFDRVVLFSDRSFIEDSPRDLTLRPIPESLTIRALRGAARRIAPRRDSAALPNSPVRAPRSLQRLWMHLRARGFADSVARCLAGLLIGPTDRIHVLIQQADLYEISGVNQYWRRYAAFTAPPITFHLILRHDSDITRARQEDPAEFRDRLIRLSSSTHPRVIFHTDSEAIASDYGSFTDRQVPINVVPIPVCRLAESMRRPWPTHAADCLRIAIMGSSRLERGFGTLATLITQLPPRFSDTRVCLTVQVNRCSADPHVRQIIRWLDTRVIQNSPDTPVLELWDGPATDDVYFGRFADSDILIAPYTSLKYVRSTSGVFVEALYLGVPAVVMHGTWAAGILQDALHCGFAIGEIAVGIGEIPSRVQRLWERLSHYKNDLRRYLEVWKARHSTNIAKHLLTSAPGGYAATAE